MRRLGHHHEPEGRESKRAQESEVKIRGRLWRRETMDWKRLVQFALLGSSGLEQRHPADTPFEQGDDRQRWPARRFPLRERTAQDSTRGPGGRLRSNERLRMSGKLTAIVTGAS